MPNPLVMAPVLGCGLTRAHDRDAGRNTASPRPSDIFSCVRLRCTCPFGTVLFQVCFSSVVSCSLSLSCTQPRTTDRDHDVLTSFHLVQCWDSNPIFSIPVSNMTSTNHSTITTTTKSWRSDVPIILPGWECHTGGSRSKPTVHRCRQRREAVGCSPNNATNEPHHIQVHP